jgi:hypothetical protein
LFSLAFSIKLLRWWWWLINYLFFVVQWQLHIDVCSYLLFPFEIIFRTKVYSV